MGRLRITLLLGVIFGIPTVALLVPVVGLIHSCPANGCPSSSWPAWYGSITWSLWGFGVAFGGTDLMTFTLGDLGVLFIVWSYAIVALVSLAIVYFMVPKKSKRTGEKKQSSPEAQSGKD